MHGRSPDPRASRPRRLARLLGWNALVLFVLLALGGGAAELYLRLTLPFRESVLPVRAVPGVGVLLQPHAEVRHTNGLDFWRVSRANSLGFLDREPPAPERAAASCHVTFIGDSFVEALEVPIADKAQVRLEELAAREAPGLDVTTSAFGRGRTGQINQLAFYDAHARRLAPDLVVLVFFPRNDFWENSLPLASLIRGYHPDWPPYLYAERAADGAIRLIPPSPEALRRRLVGESGPALGERIERGVREASWFADWLFRRARPPSLPERDAGLIARAGALSRIPGHEAALEGWEPSGRRAIIDMFREEQMPPVFRDAVAFTAFALEQFRERADRDGLSLVMLMTHHEPEDRRLERVREMTAAARIPVISLDDHIVAVGGNPADANWANDGHWNPTGHQWAAEAIWEWLKANPEVCD